MRNILFIDFEASALSMDIWRIEVGLTWTNTSGSARSWSSLISPAADWPEDLWSLQSAQHHGFARDVLERVEWTIVVADASASRQRWMDMLLETVGGQGSRAIYDYDAITGRMFDGQAQLVLLIAGTPAGNALSRARRMRMAEAGARGGRRAHGPAFRPEHGPK